jgi:hypothetical protein
MEAMRESGTDDRLDDLNGKVDRVHERFDQMYRVLIGFCGLMFATVVSLIAVQM